MAYLRDHFLPDFNAEFGRPPADAAAAFVAAGGVDLEQILCHQDERVVARDNTVVLDRVILQLAKQPGRRSCVVGATYVLGPTSSWANTGALACEPC